MFKNHFYKPTPVFYRAIGDAILYGIGIPGALDAVARGQEAIGIAMIAAMLGKFLSNYPTEKK